VAYRIEGFMWHQGENDMFDKEFRTYYSKNLKNFLAKWRRDLKTPNLKFYIGELCTKTVWGMDIIVCTTARSNEEAKALLTEFGLPFRT
jgi:hypothetical protein